MAKRRTPKKIDSTNNGFVHLGSVCCQTCGQSLDVGVSESQLRLWLALSVRHSEETARAFGDRCLQDLMTLLRNSHVRHRCHKLFWSFQCPN